MGDRCLVRQRPNHSLRFLTKPMRVMRLAISSELFCAMFAFGHHSAYSVVDCSIPDGARIINVRHGWPNVIELLLESENFPELTEGEVIPELSPVIVNGLVEMADA